MSSTASGADPGEADAQLRLLAAQRAAVAVAADAGGEAARRLERRTPERGVAAEDVADPDPAGRQPPLGAAHHPVELLREPGRPPADAQLGTVRPPTASTRGSAYPAAKWRSQSRSRHGVVVQESDHLAAGGGDAGVASGGTGRAAPRWPGRARRRSPRTRGPAGPAGGGLWSTTRSVSSAGYDCARTEETAARMSSQRSSVYTQITTEMPGSVKRPLPARCAAAGSGGRGGAGHAGWTAPSGSPSAPAVRPGRPAGCWCRGSAGTRGSGSPAPSAPP